MTAPAAPDRPHTAKRWQWLDAAKGLGIALIVWGHIYSINEASALQVYVYAFHVPLFFFISGLTFNPHRQTLVRFVKTKARSLLLPYFCYALLGYAFYFVGYSLAQSMGLTLSQFDYGLWPPLIGVFYGSLGDGHLVNTPVWFVIALFCTLLIGQLLNQAVASKPLSMALALLIGAGGQWVGQQVKLPFSLAPAMLGLVFFQAAYLLKPWVFSPRITPATKWLVMLVGLVVSLWSQVNGFVAVATPSVGHFGWFLLFGFAGSIAVIALAQLLEPHGTWLARLGRYSMSIMVIHFLVIKSVKVVMTAVLHVDMTTMDNSSALGAFVLLATAILLIPTVFVMERYLPWTLGKTPPATRLAAGS